MNYIGEKIKELRRKNNMTQEKLADYLSVTYQTVSKWETGITNPDLHLIVPIARLFGVTTDELFDYNESVDQIKTAKLKKAYDDTFKTGDLNERLVITEEAVKTFPGDMDWLNKYAWDIWCNAFSIQEDKLFNTERNKAIDLFKKVIENCLEDEIRCHAIVGIVQCLTGSGKNEEARKYAELYPDVKISADEKANLIASCARGDEQIKLEQDRLLSKTQDLLQHIIGFYSSYDLDEVGKIGENIIKLIITDGNYQTFNHELYMLKLSQARAKIRINDLDGAMILLSQAKEYAIAYDNVKGEYSYTTPLFDKVVYNSNNWCKTGATSTFDDFKNLFDFPSYIPMRKHKNFAELLK